MATTRERMVISTALLVREQGARATSIDDVLAHSGAPRGSVYHHFPGGRQQLLSEAIDYAGEFVAARIETAGGVLAVQPGNDGAAVDIGAPSFEWEQIPLAYAMDTRALPVAWEDLEQPAAVNVGNPHAIFFVEDCDAVVLPTR